jgi:hypothetical protein
MSHATADFDPDTFARIVRIYREGGVDLRVRSRDEFELFFQELDLMDPGVEVPHRWRPALDPPRAMDAQISFYAAVGRT